MNQLHFSPSAQQDLLEIKQYIEEDLRNPTAAESTVQRILQSLHILKQYAQAGTPLATLTAVKADYRFIACGNYMSFYRIRQTDIYIDRILYSHRNYLRILLQPAPSDDNSDDEAETFH